MERDDDEGDSGESNLMHFPAHDEQSLHEMMQQCIMQVALLHNTVMAEPSPYIKHWAHCHQLALRNKNTKPSTLDLNQKLEDTELLICDGCTKPIFLVDDVFYDCNLCNFSLHLSCAQFPLSVEHHLVGKLFANKIDFATLNCQGCNFSHNGILLWNETIWLDIRCASLPTKIKHEGHRHPLYQLKYQNDKYCRACGDEIVGTKEAIMYGCEKCGFFVHIRCVLRPHMVKHRWDSHPLYLILFPDKVSDHPHEYNCEFCSQHIYPGGWFYHCNICDLSFHTQCIDPYFGSSKMKFGATNIYSDLHPHLHGLTSVMNKKKRMCQICQKDAFGRPVLECSPCKYIVHNNCFLYRK